MSKKCEICGKGPVTGHHLSHAHNRINRRWLPNLQRIRVVIDGIKKKVRVCTSCIRSGKIQKAA